MSSACHCCDSPPCPEPELEFLSISGYPGDCGYLPGAGIGSLCVGFSTPSGLPAIEFQRRYSKIIRTETLPLETESFPEGAYGFDTATRTFEFTSTMIAERQLVGEDCVTEDLTGSSSWSISISGSYDETPTGDYLINYGYVGACEIVAGCWNGEETLTANYAISGESSSTSATSFSGAVDELISGSWSGSTFTQIYNDGTVVTEYVDPLPLIFPEWHDWDTPEEELEDGQGDLEEAVKDEGDVKVRIKWRIKNLPTGTCYLRVWVRKTFTPDPTEEVPFPEPVVTIIEAEWEGTGNPCFEFPLLGAGHADNTVFTDEVLNPDPTFDGIDSFEVLKYACIPDYEPEIGNPAKPNGYPAPEEE